MGQSTQEAGESLEQFPARSRVETSSSDMLSAWRTLASAPLLRRSFTSTRPLLKLAAPPPPPDDKLPTGCMVGVVVSNKMMNSSSSAVLCA